MKKSAFLLGLLLLAAAPSFAQYQEFGVLLGGSNRTFKTSEKNDQPGLPSDNFKLNSSVKEVWYAVDLEPGTMFKIKIGEIDGLVGAVSKPGDPLSPVKGKYEHVDGIIDYRFSEPFGSTGLFAGVGLYRGSAPGQSETNYGFSGGVNGDFPLSRRYGIVVEGTYHWLNLSYRPRLITATGGLRIRF